MDMSTDWSSPPAGLVGSATEAGQSLLAKGSVQLVGPPPAAEAEVSTDEPVLLSPEAVAKMQDAATLMQARAPLLHLQPNSSFHLAYACCSAALVLGTVRAHASSKWGY